MINGAMRLPMPMRLDPVLGDPSVQRLRAAAWRGDWETIRDILQAADDPDHRAFLVAATVGPGRSPAWLNTWAAAEPQSALPMLLWGEHAVTSAWVARGSGYANTVTRRGWRGFREWLAYAETCLLEAAARDPGDPLPWALLVTTARGRGLPLETAERRFAEVTARHRWHLLGHGTMLQYLCAKWWGSHEQMHRFAGETVDTMPAGSPLGALVAVAHFEHRNRLSGRHRRAYLADPAVLASLHRAADRSVRHPDYVRPPGMPRDEAYFAVMFLACGDGRAANEMFAGLRRCVPEMPFAYSRLPAPVNFVRLRLAAALAARLRPRP